MAFQFDCDGFLSDRRSELEADIDEAYGKILAPARQINHDCHELIFGADVRNRDPQALLVATLFLRALEHYQATLILIATGIVATAKATLRALMETVFLVRAIASDEEIRIRYINADLLHRKKLINRARNHSYPNLTELREALTGELIEEIDRQIGLSGAKEIRVEELSKIAGMHDWYITAYAMLSKADHTQVREAEVYFGFGVSGEVRELVYAPSMEQIPYLTLTAAELILIAASAVDQALGANFASKSDGHRKMMKQAWDSLNEEQSS